MTKTINNNIQESYCSFEVSKLLKEKGFDCICTKSYMDFGMDGIPDMRIVNHITKPNILAPTYALAIEWIRTNFDHHIENIRNSFDKYEYCIDPNKKLWETLKETPIHSKKQFKIPQEATEAALLYTLKNLI